MVVSELVSSEPAKTPKNKLVPEWLPTRQFNTNSGPTVNNSVTCNGTKFGGTLGAPPGGGGLGPLGW